MTSKRILTSNERVQRLDALARKAFAERNFIKAESIWKEQIEMLESFKHVDDLSMAMALYNLALTLNCQGRVREAEKIEERVRKLCAMSIAQTRKPTVERHLTVAI